MPSQPKEPNVLVIIMDDLCWGDLACHGNPVTKTPHLDTLHDESARLTRYVSGPLCSPARASLMTGRYHLRTRVIDTYCGRSMIDPDEITLGRLFTSAGYRTGCFGKWHLGDEYPMRPLDLGFQETLTHRGGGIGQPGDFVENIGRDSYFDPWLERNGTPEQVTGYCTDIFADATIDFLRRHKDERWFACLATNAPHTPLIVADEWADPYRALGVPEAHARLYGMVANIDWNVGRILQALDETGQADDTIVLYTSDHGPCSSAAHATEDGRRLHRFNGGLRGIKGTQYEGGIRVPSFWRWRGKFWPQDVDRIAHPIDLLPTFASLCGLQVPEDRRIDGRDLAPLLKDDAPQQDWPDRTLFMQWHRGDEPVRYRNFAAIQQDWKLVRPVETAPDELYCISQDPLEQNDRACEQPEIVRDLRQQYEAWLEDVSSTRPENYAPPPIVVGADLPVVRLTRQDWRVHGPDGWSDQHQGHYELLVRNAGRYRACVRFAKPPPVLGSVHLKIGEQHLMQPTRDAVTDYVAALDLPAGPVRLEAWSDAVEQYAAALHVELRPWRQ